MRLFWEHGYEGVSIADLTAAMRIAPPSLYAAFGSKEALYLECLDRYMVISATVDFSVFATGLSLELAVRELLLLAIHTATTRTSGRGCMINSGMLDGHSANESLVKELAARREGMRKGLAQWLGHWVEEKEADRVSRYLATLFQGISIQARDGATAEELKTMADDAVLCFRNRQPAASKPGVSA